MKLIDTTKRKILTFLELYSIPKYKGRNVGIEMSPIIDDIRNEHATYISQVSSKEMAMSFELALFLYSYCESTAPKRVLDMGSGFSSFVLRTYEKHNSNVEVFSVDDNAEWLLKTGKYLKSHGLSTSNLSTLKEFESRNHSGGFDVILLDLNFVDVRIKYLEFCKKILVEGGTIIIDDTHKIEFLREVKNIVDKLPGELINIRSQTLDDLGRFSLLYKM